MLLLILAPSLRIDDRAANLHAGGRTLKQNDPKHRLTPAPGDAKYSPSTAGGLSR